jgi:hypothetical protein
MRKNYSNEGDGKMTSDKLETEVVHFIQKAVIDFYAKHCCGPEQIEVDDYTYRNIEYWILIRMSSPYYPQSFLSDEKSSICGLNTATGLVPFKKINFEGMSSDKALRFHLTNAGIADDYYYEIQ